MNPASRGRILVVDDDRNVRSVLSIRLRAAGYDVVEIEDGHVALELVGEGGIDVIVLDALMPGMDGFEVISRLRKIERCPRVLLLTALPDNDHRIRALRGGAVTVIAKPVEPAAFLELVSVAVRERRKAYGSAETTGASPDKDCRGDIACRFPHLIPRMMSDVNKACRSMEEAEQNDDMKAIELLAHKIKGTCGVFGFATLSDLGGALEVSAEIEDKVETKRLVIRLASHLEELAHGNR